MCAQYMNGYSFRISMCEWVWFSCRENGGVFRITPVHHSTQIDPQVHPPHPLRQTFGLL